MCSHSIWTKARLNQGWPRLGQVTAGASLAVAGNGNRGTGAGHGCNNGRQWSGAAIGDGTSTYAAGVVEAGHGTTVETAALRQGAATAYGKGGWEGEGKME